MRPEPEVAGVADHEPVAAWKLLAIGLAAGVFGGGLGVGGGIIMVPLLVFIGLGRHRAHATSLAGIVLIATAGAASFAVSGEMDLVVGLTIGIGGIAGSVLGATVMHRMSPRGLTVAFAIVVIVAGLRMVAGGDPAQGSSELGSVVETLISLGIGAVAGFFAGLAGIGGGVVNVPAMVFLLGLGQHTAQGTSLLAIILTAAAGTITNYRNRRVRFGDGFLVGVGGAVGSIVGSRVALGTSEETLSLVFGLLILFVGARSLYRVLLRPEADLPDDTAEGL